MEEIDKSPEGSLYITAAVPELVYQTSQDLDSENSFGCSYAIHTNKFEVNEVHEQIIENIEEEEEKEKITQDKEWKDVALTDTFIPSLTVITPEENVYEVPNRPDRHQNHNSIIIKNFKLVHEGFLGTSSYFIYEIESNINNKYYKVTRRYKDFDWLYHSLKENYKGMSVPPLPPKTLSVLQDKKTAELRKAQLEKCLEILLKHSTLKNSKQLSLFLTFSDLEFLKAREDLKISSVSFKYNDLEDAIDQIISKIQAKMNQIFSLRIVPFSKDLVEIDRYLNQIQAPTYSLSIAFNMTINSTQRSNSILQNIHFSHSNEFYKTMQLHKYLIYQSDCDLNSVSNHFQEENLKVEALRGAIEDYKITLRKYSELETLIERKIIKSRKSINDVERYMAEIEVIKKDINNIEKEVVSIENNIKNEKIWFQAERDEHLESVLNQVFDVYKNRLSQEEGFWLEKKHEMS
jgi:PX domain